LARPPRAELVTDRSRRGGLVRPRRLSLSPELDCLRAHIAAPVLEAAERYANTVGVGADRVLIADGTIDEEDYVAALADWIGVAFDPLDPHAAKPAAESDILNADASGMLRVEADGRQFAVVVPRGLAARRLCQLARQQRVPDLHLTSSARLKEFVAHHGRSAIAHRAADALFEAHPLQSAKHRDLRMLAAGLGMLAVLIAAGLYAPTPTLGILNGMASLVIVAGIVLRLLTIGRSAAATEPSPRPDRDLPVYTVIVALYREARVVPDLIAALDALDYPPEKLDIKFVLEADDNETIAAIDMMEPGPSYDIIIVPPGGPRTKPHALNVALCSARGRFTAVFDAEDIPERDQLRRAADMFMRYGERLSCVQARLSIHNTEDSWLTRLFTAEYCGLFDVFLPGLSARRLPLPLGGSSNHFHTATLREIGGWDPYNVTEDADLGYRLARRGGQTCVIESTTYEEAPATLQAWLKQRRRWFKGWMQTWLVHMRAPVRLFRELRLGGFLTFQLVVGGTTLAALIHPIFLALLAWEIAAGIAAGGNWSGAGLMAALYGSLIVLGYAISAGLATIGLARRRLMSSAPWLALIPVLWVLLSIAAWGALIQLVCDPYRWDKTEHGLARTSRRRRR
jgi:cellulose synthase/poly-beta-1,6-N-acetylglucosamine synthase-like glycosyltransferase